MQKSDIVDMEVTLTATVTKEDVSTTKDFVVTIGHLKEYKTEDTSTTKSWEFTKDEAKYIIEYTHSVNNESGKTRYEYKKNS